MEGEDSKRSRDEERGKDQGEGTGGAWMRILRPDGRLTKCSEIEAKGLGGHLSAEKKLHLAVLIPRSSQRRARQTEAPWASLSGH